MQNRAYVPPKELSLRSNLWSAVKFPISLGSASLNRFDDRVNHWSWEHRSKLDGIFPCNMLLDKSTQYKLWLHWSMSRFPDKLLFDISIVSNEIMLKMVGGNGPVKLLFSMFNAVNLLRWLISPGIVPIRSYKIVNVVKIQSGKLKIYFWEKEKKSYHLKSCR